MQYRNIIDEIIDIPEFKKQVKSFLSFKKDDLKCYLKFCKNKSGIFGCVALDSIPKTVYDIVEINLLNLQNIDGDFSFSTRNIYSSIILENGEPFVNILNSIIPLNDLKDRLDVSLYIDEFEKKNKEDKNIQ